MATISWELRGKHFTSAQLITSSLPVLSNAAMLDAEGERVRQWQAALTAEALHWHVHNGAWTDGAT